MDVLPSDVRNELLVPIRFEIENDAHLLPLALVPEPLAPEKQPEFERHVETWEPGFLVQADV